MNTLGKLLAGGAAALLPALAGASSIALPIATDVNVVNTPKVTVTNPVTSVTLSNPAVTVNNPSTSPVLVRDVDRGQPVGGFCSANYGTVNNVKRCDLYTVPAGKRLVVEELVYRLAIEGNPGSFPYYVIVVNSGTSDFLSLAPTFTGSDGTNHYTNTVGVHYYLNAGATLSILAQFSQPTILGSDYSFTGRLIDE